MAEPVVEGKDRPQVQPPQPWDTLFGTHGKFLNALDCVREMFNLVAPVLEAKDKERERRIDELSEEIRDSDGR